jgi:NAD(P)-dependent dehydrogenase (short-subunit alcohol dehydrogenase family)
MKRRKPVVLVTGTSSGVGLALVKELIDGPLHVVATALPTSLHLLAEAGVHADNDLWIRGLDVVDLESQASLVDEIKAELGGVDILVNNAAISYRSVVEEMSDEDELRQMSINYLGPMNLIRLVLPGMRACRSGKIINVSSVGGMMAMPTMGSYSASKWALEGATEALWYEMRPWHVGVCLVEPGFIHSLAFRKVLYARRHGGRHPEESDYLSYYRSMTPFVERLMEFSVSDSAAVASVIHRMIRRREMPLRVPATLDALFFHFMRRLTPRWIYHRLLYRFLPNRKTWGPGP